MFTSTRIEETEMKSVSTTEFHSQCLQLIKEVRETGVPLVITDNGQPVAQLGPVPDLPTLIGAHRGKIRILGDIVEPVGEEWEASR
jgi:prevent-host-death family protein